MNKKSVRFGDVTIINASISEANVVDSIAHVHEVLMWFLNQPISAILEGRNSPRKIARYFPVLGAESVYDMPLQVKWGSGPSSTTA